MNFIRNQYGTYKGFIRTLICYIKDLLGFYKSYKKINWQSVKRIIFVCKGNICRSPYAEAYAKSMMPCFDIISCGIDKSNGNSAYHTAIHVADKRNIDLTQHKSQSLDMIHIKQGDLIIGVEDRHLPYLHAITKDNTDVQITLLGLWMTPVKCPLLYDPHHLSDAYFDVCFQRIENAIQGIKSKLTLY